MEENTKNIIVGTLAIILVAVIYFAIIFLGNGDNCDYLENNKKYYPDLKNNMDSIKSLLNSTEIYYTQGKIIKKDKKFLKCEVDYIVCFQKDSLNYCLKDVSSSININLTELDIWKQKK